MFDKLAEKLNDLFPSFDKFGNKRDPLENYIAGSSISIIALMLNALLFASLFAFGKSGTTAHTVAIAAVVSSTMIILSSWATAIANIKSHRENMDYHREYMRKFKNTKKDN